MSDHGYAFFVERPRRIDELMFPHLIEREREYEVVKTIRLPKINYENFVTDMVADRQFLEDNSGLCGKDGSIIRCLRVTHRGSRESILVVPDDAWVDIAALLRNEEPPSAIDGR